MLGLPCIPNLKTCFLLCFHAALDSWQQGETGKLDDDYYDDDDDDDDDYDDYDYDYEHDYYDDDYLYLDLGFCRTRSSRSRGRKTAVPIYQFLRKS